MNTRVYTFGFYDADTKDMIKDCKIEVSLINQGESPQNFLSDSSGLLKIKTDKGKIKLLIQSPYYKTVTIDRVLKKFNREENIALHANEYALMLRYFTQMKVSDWQKRRLGLDKILDDRAVIYQVYQEKYSPGLQLLNKQEFIDKLTFPSTSLQQLEILETKSLAGKILILKFRLNEMKK